MMTVFHTYSAASRKYLLRFDVDSNVIVAHNNSENEVYRF
jgi:hypothetical protein